MKTFITKTAPSWSFILMLLVTVDKSSEFDWICVDQRLNLVFESRAILHGMPSNSSMVFTLSIDIVLFWIWRSPRPYGDGMNPVILNQYGEELCIRHWKWIIHFGPFSLLGLVIPGSDPWSYSCANLWGDWRPINGTWAYPGERGWLLTGSSRIVCDLLFSPDIAWRCSSGTNLFLCSLLAPVSTILPLFIPSSILPTKYIKFSNSMKVFTISMS